MHIVAPMNVALPVCAPLHCHEHAQHPCMYVSCVKIVPLSLSCHYRYASPEGTLIFYNGSLGMSSLLISRIQRSSRDPQLRPSLPDPNVIAWCLLVSPHRDLLYQSVLGGSSRLVLTAKERGGRCTILLTGCSNAGDTAHR